MATTSTRRSSRNGWKVSNSNIASIMPGKGIAEYYQLEERRLRRQLHHPHPTPLHHRHLLGLHLHLLRLLEFSELVRRSAIGEWERKNLGVGCMRFPTRIYMPVCPFICFESE
jgi:hypothetical protein